MILALLDQAYDHPSWHGTNLRGSLRRVTLAEAAWRPGPGRHNIWEIAVHAAYWKYAAWRRLTGATRGAFPLKGSNWFTRPLERSAALSRTPKGSKVSNFALLSGVAAHDLYHAGQIQLLKRLARRV